MVKKYARYIEERQLNTKTGSTWSIFDVPGTWQSQTEKKVIDDGYYFDEDGTAYPNGEDRK